MIFAPFTAWKKTINSLVNLLSLLGRLFIKEPLLRKIVAFFYPGVEKFTTTYTFIIAVDHPVSHFNSKRFWKEV